MKYKMNLGFKKNLLIGYSISLLLVLISAIASYVSITMLLDYSGKVSHTNQVISKLDGVLSILKDAETGQRGFLLTGDDRFLEPYNGSREKSAALIDSIKTLTNDNAQQQENIAHLARLAKTRLSGLAYLINEKRNGQPIGNTILLEGKSNMDSVRLMVRTMENQEQQLLTARSKTLGIFSTYTPVIIVIASLLSLLVTVISFYRVINDYNNREILQQELIKKDEDISARLAIIKDIADKVSAGDYKIRLGDERKDVLGNIAGSLNKMAESLDSSFTNLSNQEWLQTGIANFNDAVLGEQDINTLTQNMLDMLATYTDSQAGAFYMVNNEGALQLISGYALPAELKKLLAPGEGLSGQCAKSGKIMELKELTSEDYVLNYVSGKIKPRSVIAIPVVYNRTIKAVIELASVKDYSKNTHLFFETASQNGGIAINTAQARQKVQELLEETQSQSEELQAQHSELENINAELEAQAEKLQASEEELRVQQEELQQANQELEERSRLLEEKNELILERNLEIQSRAEELALSTKYKSEFLANMSHELRTPLNSILLLSRLLSENHGKNLSTDQVEYATVIQSSGTGLLTLIDEILDLSKIESGKMELDYGDMSISEMTGDIKSLFEAIAKEKGIGFAINISEDTPGMIHTDRLRLEQIIRNLISNALKFTRHGAVTLGVSKQNGAIAFTVKDTGIGIAPEKQQTIFEAFQQADGSTRRKYGGTGLGLSISRELAKLLGGEIRLKSEEGTGSEFTLVLPLEKPTPELVADKIEPLIIPEEEKPARHLSDDQYISQIIPDSIPDDRNNIGKNDRVILIIEDDTGFARSLLDYTRQKGYKGIVAVRGDEGIDFAKKYLPLGILLDVQLPIKSGWDVMGELKSNPNTRPIPVHMMSSHQVKTKSISKGAIDFINKPVAFEKLGEIFQKIEHALSRHPKKVLIVEENPKHAQALAYFLEGFSVNAEITNTVGDGIQALNSKEVDCVILDMGIPATGSYDTLELVKKTPGLENLPIIIFTGKNLSHIEEMRIKQYADSIVIKTAHSYQRILDEVSLFLHLVEENKKDNKSTSRYQKLGELGEVLKGKTVLVADDDVRNIFSLTKSLENYGIHVISSIDGKDALKQLNEHDKIDLVLMDMMMPEMDGYESTRRIREIYKYRNLPVIAVTAKAMTGDREKCIAAGASDYITKPVDVDQLISLLRVWLYA